MYKFILKPIFFLFDPEKIHHFTFGLLRFLFAIPGVGGIFRSLHTYRHPKLEKEIFGLKFKNPVGLAAGFDKQALIGDKWENLGFGFVELGTVTPRSQVGNPKPRLFRLKEDGALINRMGFNNGGLEIMVARLKKMQDRSVIIGGNIGKNKDTPNEHAVDDYVKCFDALHAYVDYFVVNVSSPNTPGLRELQDKKPLTKLLRTLMELNEAKKVQRPILLKIAPDLTNGQLDDIIAIVADTGIAGLVATNTTISRKGLVTPSAQIEQIGNGGLSGAPLSRRAIEVVSYINTHSKQSIPIIGVGGIMNPKDAREMMKAGASLVQIYSGFVYGGPGLPKRICKELAV